MKKLIYVLGAILVLAAAGCDVDDLFGLPDLRFQFQVGNETDTDVSAQVVGRGANKQLGTIHANSVLSSDVEVEVPSTNERYCAVNFNFVRLTDGKLFTVGVTLDYYYPVYVRIEEWFFHKATLIEPLLEGIDERERPAALGEMLRLAEDLSVYELQHIIDSSRDLKALRNALAPQK